MKMAIIGSGPLAFKTSEYFCLLGAEITLFTTSETAHLNLNVNIQIKKAEVLRIHKRFLAPSEKIENRSRLLDLFRVVYSFNPTENILTQVKNNPEMFSKLGEKVLESLKFPVESFEDFDLVIEIVNNEMNPYPMGPSLSYAINEINLSQNSAIFYEKENFKRLNLEKITNLVLVGKSKSITAIFLELKKWLIENQSNKIMWVIDNNFKELELEDSVKELLNYFEQQYKIEIEKYESKLFTWRELEDYVRVKVEKPSLPHKKIEIYSGCSVTAVDRLIDQESLFITIESPSFREDFKVENELKTLSSDCIVVANGYQKKSKATGLCENEIGFFYCEESDGVEETTVFKNIERQILSYFTKVETND